MKKRERSAWRSSGAATGTGSRWRHDGQRDRWTSSTSYESAGRRGGTSAATVVAAIWAQTNHLRLSAATSSKRTVLTATLPSTDCSFRDATADLSSFLVLRSKRRSALPDRR